MFTLDPGVPLAEPRFTPGYMLSPASQAHNNRANLVEIFG